MHVELSNFEIRRNSSSIISLPRCKTEIRDFSGEAFKSL